jgi:EAL domain-containing protein (putative c-di-GMP-specific phosphodiesterase class I)
MTATAGSSSRRASSGHARPISDLVIRRAIEWGEIEVWFQPVVALESGELRGAEALLRRRPRHAPDRVIEASAFIEAAEECGAIPTLGRLALDAACHLAACRPDIPQVRINLSPCEIGERFVGRVLEAAGRHGVDPRRLVFELTEQASIEPCDAVVACLQALRSTGAGLELDDFGTGQNTLLRLARLPVSGLKLDRAFVAAGDARASRIIEWVIGLAGDLDLRVTAEGIERIDQWHALREVGCAQGQGFLFGRAAPLAGSVEAWSAVPRAAAVMSAEALPR